MPTRIPYPGEVNSRLDLIAEDDGTWSVELFKKVNRRGGVDMQSTGLPDEHAALRACHINYMTRTAGG